MPVPEQLKDSLKELSDLKAALERRQVYSDTQTDEFVQMYLGGAERDKLDPILDACVAVYKEQLNEDGQVEFKGDASNVWADFTAATP